MHRHGVPDVLRVDNLVDSHDRDFALASPSVGISNITRVFITLVYELEYRARVQFKIHDEICDFSLVLSVYRIPTSV